MTSLSASPDSKSKRRFLQFSLRTLFVLMTVFAVWFGWRMHKAREQARTVEWVEKMGGTVWYDYWYDEDGKAISDGVPPGPKWMTDVLGVDFVADVTFVNCTGASKVHDLTPLAGLKELRYLALSHTEVNDITPLSGLRNLELLWLDGAPVSDIAPLSALEKLEDLDLDGTPVSKEQVNALHAALPNCTIRWTPAEE